MSREDLAHVAAIVLGAVGTYLMLPHRLGRVKPRVAHLVGGALAAVGLLLMATSWHPAGDLLLRIFFYAFALGCVGGGIMTVTSRNPVYSALWFAAVVLASSGLFLLAGAQFLAAGTIIVYAGAIIVTFLFVIMLAQSEGQATYDRAARSPEFSILTSFLLLWAVGYALLQVRTPRDVENRDADPITRRLAPAAEIARTFDLPAESKTAAVLARAIRPTAPLPTAPGASHMASLGGTLYSDHLIAVEVAGALLFVALIGAAAIASPRPPIRPNPENN